MELGLRELDVKAAGGTLCCEVTATPVRRSVSETVGVMLTVKDVGERKRLRAAIAALNGSLDAVAEMKVAFDRRRRTIVSMLNAIPGLQCPEPEGAFYAYPSAQGVLGKEIRGRRPANTTELAEIILDEAEVAVVPGEAFGTPGFLRLSYALSDADLEEGVNRIAALLAEATG